MVSNHYHGGSIRISRKVCQEPDEILPTTEIQARARLVEKQKLRVDHQSASDHDTLLFPLAERAPRALPQVESTDLLEDGDGLVIVHLLVFLTPATEDGISRRDDEVSDLFLRWDALRDGCGADADLCAQIPHVRLADLLPHEECLPGRREFGCAGELHQRGFSRAVGADDYPALVEFDLPGNRSKQGLSVASEGHIRKIND